MTGADVRAGIIRALRSTGERLALGAISHRVEPDRSLAAGARPVRRFYHSGAGGVRTTVLECDTGEPVESVLAIVDSCIYEIEAQRAAEDAAQLSLLPPRGLGR